MSVEQKANMLESSRWGRALPWATISKLAPFMGVYRLKAGATIFRQGDRSQFLMVIMEGEAVVLKESAEGEEQQIATLGANRPLGEMGLIDGQARSATVRVTKECIALVLTSRGFDEMREKTPTIWGEIVLKIAAGISQKLRSTSGQLADCM